MRVRLLLTGLLNSQAKDLVEKVVSAIALTRETKDLDKKLKEFGQGKYQVGFIGPEMALTDKFHKLILDSKVVQKKLVAVSIDEAHNISEWGTDDFRAGFAHISLILARVPGVPIMATSNYCPVRSHCRHSE
ncbi:hypothetical protein K435DRAFT_801358 [Dendrothele bispora CBS 962.96]|uniref:Helicase ATP-binding domain-containing protein n=1 Tax=Dendrothele bispora (strain CBS 962.96) TaxID=1314807 RepID=A0A4S8LPQ1_DENBC|nr:hypothetical protein K435DRAFT_801358 [Dendrothele bispora CBS 962.96]